MKLYLQPFSIEFNFLPSSSLCSTIAENVKDDQEDSFNCLAMEQEKMSRSDFLNDIVSQVMYATCCG